MKITLLSKKNAAKYANVTARTIFNWLEKGMLNEYYSPGWAKSLINPFDIEKIRQARIDGTIKKLIKDNKSDE